MIVQEIVSTIESLPVTAFGETEAQRDERTILPSGRHKYKWGRYDRLRFLEVGRKTFMEKGNGRVWNLYRCVASRYGKTYGVKISIQCVDGNIYATRTQ